MSCGCRTLQTRISGLHAESPVCVQPTIQPTPANINSDPTLGVQRSAEPQSRSVSDFGRCADSPTAIKRIVTMPRYITCDADIGFPLPNVAMVAERITQLHNGHRPVTTAIIAKSFGHTVPAIQAVLDRGRRNGVLSHHMNYGWITLQR